MANEVVWDVRVVTLETDAMTVLAYIPEWNSLSFSDSINEQGFGLVSFDYDSDWLQEFYTDQSSKYPWEGLYGVQVLRDGALVYTFVAEEAEIQYVGPTRQVALGGRGLSACLEWGIVLPEGFDESLSDPDDPGNVLFMTRGFGSVATNQSDIDAGNYSVDSPQHKAYGGSAFVHLFEECDTGNATTFPNITVANANRSTAVTWPLSLSTNLSRTNDSNNVAWSTTATYPDIDTTHLFELNAGMNMFDVLLECCSLTANSQWNIKPDGTIHIAKQIGTDKSDTILLSVPQAQSSSNSLNNRDSRSFMYSSNGYLFEQQSDTTTINRYGRREGFVDADQSEGQLVAEIAKHALEEVKDQLDEFTFAYYETEDSEMFKDFAVGDTVNIEYEPGTVNSRQITALGATVTTSGTDFEVTVGDVVENSIAVLNKKGKNNQESHLITTQVGFGANHSALNTRRPVSAPSITAVTPKRDGVTRSVTIDFKTPGFVGTQSQLASKITGYEAEVYLDSDNTVKHTAYKAIDRTTANQKISVTGMGEKGSAYRAKVRAVAKERPISNFAVSSTFNMTDANEGTNTDPYKPAQVTGVTLFPMLNSILVRFTDFNSSNNPTISGPRGKYEIQISNASGAANYTTGNTWTRTLGGSTSGESSAAARTFVVPDGSGFICTGLLSVAGGRTHYVRVRAVNWDGTPGDYSATSTVSLDSSSESQVGVIIGEDSITASNIAAGTITASEIAAGAITATQLNANAVTAGKIAAGAVAASNLSVDQVAASAITLPKSSGATNASQVADGTSGNEISFSLAANGDMWWGNFSSYNDAYNRNPVSGSINNNYVGTRFKGDGSEYVIGTPNSFVGYINNTAVIGGNAEITGSLSVGTGGSAQFTAGNCKITTTRFSSGSSTNHLSIKDTTIGILDGIPGQQAKGITFGSTEGNFDHGYIAGGEIPLTTGVGIPNLKCVTMGYNFGTGVNNFVMASNIGVLIKTSSGAAITIDGDQGVQINDTGAPNSTTNKLYNDSGTLYWNGSSIGGGGGGFGTLAAPTSPMTSPTNSYFKIGNTDDEEFKITGNELADLLVNSEEIPDLTSDNVFKADLYMDGGNAGSVARIIGDGTYLFLMRGNSSSGFAQRIWTSNSGSGTATDFYNGEVSPRNINGADLGDSTYKWAKAYITTVYSDSYSSMSDRNMKTDIADETKGLDFIKQLRPVTYKWKETFDDSNRESKRAGVRTHHGFIAQEVEETLGEEATNDALWYKESVDGREESTGADGIVDPAVEEHDEYGLRYEEFLAPIVKAIQELAARVEALEG